MERETTRHLTETAWSVLDFFHNQTILGKLSVDQAQQAAVALLEQLRYRDEHKDYFWINDDTPMMIMHPYRPDLEGKNVALFTDPAGNPLFADMVEITRTSGSGFVDYLWQWKEDPTHIVPKISHVKAFEPWGWIIGTGIYVADVKAQISAVDQKADDCLCRDHGGGAGLVRLHHLGCGRFQKGKTGCHGPV
ncbi:MAG: cache domain-containing protein [Desulfurivibrio sp.]|nr:cache domain-containing protein [Desulfurivibrio sp.]